MERTPNKWTLNEVENSNETFISNKSQVARYSESSKHSFLPPTTAKDELFSSLPKLSKLNSQTPMSFQDQNNEFSTIIPSAQQVVAGVETVNSNSRELTALAKLNTSEDYNTAACLPHTMIVLITNLQYLVIFVRNRELNLHYFQTPSQLCFMEEHCNSTSLIVRVVIYQF